MKKKSAALLITLLIISSIGLLAIVALRSTIVALAGNTRITDSVVAEENTQAGLEFGLLKCRTESATSPFSTYCWQNGSSVGCAYWINLENNSVSKEQLTPDPRFQYANVEINFTVSGTSRICSVYSIGHIGSVYKKHYIASIAVEGISTGGGSDGDSVPPLPPPPPPATVTCWDECKDAGYNGGSCAMSARACSVSRRINIGHDHCSGALEVCCCDFSSR